MRSSILIQEKKFKLYCSWRISSNGHYGKVILIISFQNCVQMEQGIHPEAKTDWNSIKVLITNHAIDKILLVNHSRIEEQMDAEFYAINERNIKTKELARPLSEMSSTEAKLESDEKGN